MHATVSGMPTGLNLSKRVDWKAFSEQGVEMIRKKGKKKVEPPVPRPDLPLIYTVDFMSPSPLTADDAESPLSNQGPKVLESVQAVPAAVGTDLTDGAGTPSDPIYPYITREEEKMGILLIFELIMKAIPLMNDVFSAIPTSGKLKKSAVMKIAEDGVGFMTGVSGGGQKQTWEAIAPHASAFIDATVGMINNASNSLSGKNLVEEDIPPKPLIVDHGAS